MTPLLCITPGPAIDRTAYVERIVRDTVLRPRELVVLPGGKGVNAARAAVRLGGAVMTTGIAGGHAGRWIVEALAAEGLDPHFSVAAAESRTTYVTVDDHGEAVIVYEQPGAATEREFAAFLALLEQELLPRCGRALVAGSVPGGVGPTGYARIVEACRRAERPLLVDASGPSLLAALAAQPEIVKIGQNEAREAGLAHGEAGGVEAALVLLDRGARLAVVTDGPRSVVAADAQTIWQVEVPQVAAVNTVGSGDSFNAALSLALMHGSSTEVALTKGVAAGSANAMAIGAGMLHADIARELEAAISVSSTSR